jgi:EAL domain-containing protein (putative c-di-GMP-specific phosphodiesterase class I)
LRLAAALDLSVVAEGIEHAQQANTLRQLECSLGQGFYFDRPLNAADAERRLAGAAPPATRIRAA